MVLQVLLLLFAAVGIFHICRALLALLHWLWASFLRPLKDLKRYGSWAIVTGPTDGIGKELSFLLGRHGLNLVLIGRNPSKLSSVSGEILKKYSCIKVKSIVVDLSKDVDEGMKKIGEGIAGLDVGILINNAGTGYGSPRFLHEADENLVESIIRVNVQATTRLTHLLLPVMLNKKKGAIVNIGSGAGSLLPSYPLNTIYAATKSYIGQFSRSLAVEYEQFGIDVQCQVPLLVATKMINRKPSFFIPSPEKFAEGCLRRIGQESICAPYWPHGIQWFAVRYLMPDALLNQWHRNLFLRFRQQVKLQEQQLKDFEREGGGGGGGGRG